MSPVRHFDKQGGKIDICNGVRPEPKPRKREKLRRNPQFKEVYIRGRKINGPRLTIFYKPNQLLYSRLGLSVSKKRFKLSTRRHYIQRRLREAYRALNKTRFLPGYDIIIKACRFENNIRFENLKRELLNLLRKGGLTGIYNGEQENRLRR